MFRKLKSFLWWTFITGVFTYCVWLFLSAIDAHLTNQMNLWNENLGM